MKESTRNMIATFRERRTLLTTPAQRSLAAECIRFRLEHWGHKFTRDHESSICNQLEYVIMSRLTSLQNSV